MCFILSFWTFGKKIFMFLSRALLMIWWNHILTLHVQHTTQRLYFVISVKVEIGFHMLDIKLWVKNYSITFEAGERLKLALGSSHFCWFLKFWVNFNWLSLQTIAFVFCWNPAAFPAESNGYIRVDCYGGLNQMRRDVSVY